MTEGYDVLIIGAGPAGYVCAIRAAQLGLKAGCIDDWRNPDGQPALGGTCLNAGCIPSKALLESSELYHRLQASLDEHGIRCTDPAFDLEAMLARKERVVRGLTGGIETLFRAHGIRWLQGRGRLLGPRRVEFRPAAGGEARVLEARAVVLAPGSRPIRLDSAPLDGETVVDSGGALAFAEVPRRLAIIGAGVIGLELGSVWARLGSRVVLLEARGEFLPMVDRSVAGLALRQFTGEGLDIQLGARVTDARRARRLVTVRYQVGDEDRELKVDRLVVAVGREPNTEDLAAPESDLLLDERGYVHVNESCETNLPGVYAIGDAVRGPMLAHKGSEEGVLVAERIAGRRPPPLIYDHIPAVIYTEPEIAWVGPPEEELRRRGIELRVGVFPFAASGRARAMGDTRGFVKTIAEAETDRLLAVHIIGPGASELVNEATVALEMGAAGEDLARTVHAHPSLAESLKESALALGGEAIHVAARRR